MGEEEQVAAEPQVASEDTTPEVSADEATGTGVEPTPGVEAPTPTEEPTVDPEA